MATSVATMNKMTTFVATGGNFCKKVCKILSHIVIYIIEGAILHRLQYSRKYAMILLNERKK